MGPQVRLPIFGPRFLIPKLEHILDFGPRGGPTPGLHGHKFGLLLHNFEDNLAGVSSPLALHRTVVVWLIYYLERVASHYLYFVFE
jgi:hypothetical protein